MPRIASWNDLPPNVRQHLIDRMRNLGRPTDPTQAALDLQQKVFS
jgi:hypothetical protein